MGLKKAGRMLAQIGGVRRENFGDAAHPLGAQPVAEVGNIRLRRGEVKVAIALFGGALP
jgi:hypothetical protein